MMTQIKRAKKVSKVISHINLIDQTRAQKRLPKKSRMETLKVDTETVMRKIKLDCPLNSHTSCRGFHLWNEMIDPKGTGRNTEITVDLVQKRDQKVPITIYGINIYHLI
jgi:hypothetical protein